MSSLLAQHPLMAAVKSAVLIINGTVRATLTIPGRPKSYTAPRWRHDGRTYAAHSRKMTGAAAALAKQTEVRDLTAPLLCVVTLHFQRPLKHFKRNGELKPGAPAWILKTPDVDNYRHYRILLEK